jgi:phosphoglycolate phosphatase-like HAD superfamily hydrolase
LNIFFDMDYTILSQDNGLRPGTREVFRKLVDDGHQVYVWSGVGVRAAEVEQHGLQEYVEGVFQKPLQQFEEGLGTFGVTVRPDVVVDDYPEIVSAFGGVLIRPYLFRAPHDTEMEKVYSIVTEYSLRGSSEDSSFRPRGDGSGQKEM